MERFFNLMFANCVDTKTMSILIMKFFYQMETNLP